MKRILKSVKFKTIMEIGGKNTSTIAPPPKTTSLIPTDTTTKRKPQNILSKPNKHFHLLLWFMWFYFGGTFCLSSVCLSMFYINKFNTHTSNILIHDGYMKCSMEITCISHWNLKLWNCVKRYDTLTLVR